MLLTYCISLEVETHMPTPWPCLPPPRLKVYLILVEDLIMKREVIHVHQVRVGSSWMDPLVLFLKDDILPEEKTEADKIRRKASWFWLFEDQKLYKCSFSGPYLLCVHPEASELILEELYEWICGSHTRGRPPLRVTDSQICRKKHRSM